MRYSSGQIWAITAFVSLVYLALSILGMTSGGGLDAFFNATNVVPLLVIAGWLFEQWGWRWGLLHRIGLVSTPVVIGTWRGLMESSWSDGDTGRPDPARTVYLAVRQTAVSLSVRLLTDESSSDLVHGLVAKRPSGYPALAYTYRNEPALALQSTRSQIHHGAATVDIVGDPPTGLDGVYWTDRNTHGTLIFREHTPQVAQTREQAAGLRYGTPRPVGVLSGLRRI